MKAIKSMMMAAALPLALSMAAPVMAETTTATTPSIAGTQTAARPVRRAVRRGAVAKKSVAAVTPVKKEAKWVYTAKRMRPPKSKKWQGRWNDLGREGWELVAMSENMYIFKRPSDFSLTANFDNSAWSNDVTSAVKNEATKETTKAAKKSAKKLK